MNRRELTQIEKNLLELLDFELDEQSKLYKLHGNGKILVLIPYETTFLLEIEEYYMGSESFGADNIIKEYSVENETLKDFLGKTIYEYID